MIENSIESKFTVNKPSSQFVQIFHRDVVTVKLQQKKLDWTEYWIFKIFVFFASRIIFLVVTIEGRNSDFTYDFVQNLMMLLFKSY